LAAPENQIQSREVGQCPMIQTARRIRFDRALPQESDNLRRYWPICAENASSGPSEMSVLKGAIMQKEAWYEERGTVNPKFGSSDGASRDQPVHGATVEWSLVQLTRLPTSRSATSYCCPLNRNQPKREINPASNYYRRSPAAFPAARA
jgi:hypothetical protein